MVGTKLLFFNTTWTFEFVLIPHGVNCKSSKSHGLILYFSLIFFDMFTQEGGFELINFAS
jgi:hypothetical protein